MFCRKLKVRKEKKNAKEPEMQLVGFFVRVNASLVVSYETVFWLMNLISSIRCGK